MPAPPILVVDDNAETVAALAAMLELRGYETVSALDGLDALVQLRAGLRPSLIVLDWMMPNLDGRGFLERVAGERKPRSSRLTTSTSSKTTRWLDLARRRLPRASFRRQGRHERASGGGDAGILTFFRSRFHWMWGCARGARCVEASVMFFLLRWKSEDLICCRGR